MATVVLAGGGTAGHIEPALAVARQWMKTNPSDTCIFLGTKSGLENTLVPAAGFELRVIPKVAISRKPSVSWLRIPFDLVSSVLSAMKVEKGRCSYWLWRLCQRTGIFGCSPFTHPNCDS